jgi:hypothetical protein
MGDRAAQIRTEWFVKCASVVLQARVPSPSPAAATGKAKQNRWVRPRVERAPDAVLDAFPKTKNERPFFCVSRAKRCSKKTKTRKKKTERRGARSLLLLLLLLARTRLRRARRGNRRDDSD